MLGDMVKVKTGKYKECKGVIVGFAQMFGVLGIGGYKVALRTIVGGNIVETMVNMDCRQLEVI